MNELTTALASVYKIANSKPEPPTGLINRGSLCYIFPASAALPTSAIPQPDEGREGNIGKTYISVYITNWGLV